MAMMSPLSDIGAFHIARSICPKSIYYDTINDGNLQNMAAGKAGEELSL
ncbi:MAG: hypothetical protein ACYC5M_18265 [Anaerolineae bacterium]